MVADVFVVDFVVAEVVQVVRHTLVIVNTISAENLAISSDIATLDFRVKK